MKKIFSVTNLSITFLILFFTSCRKADSPIADGAVSTRDILNSFSQNVAYATYNDLHQQATILTLKIQLFNQSNSQNDLEACREQWKKTRSVWEQSEGFLFGPVTTNDIDPHIDTWPIDFNSLDSVMNSSAIIDANYVNGLEDALHGFHPMEYLLWGTNGNKIAQDFTSRQKEYLIALSKNIEDLTGALSANWTSGTAGSYFDSFTNAGSSTSIYSSKNAAFNELVLAMAGICEEVADGKIGEPFVSQNPNLEESPYAKNSLIDFINNIKSVKNIYDGGYLIKGVSLKNFVQQYNRSLDNVIDQKINTAIASLNAITVPFGTAIITQPVQVQQAQQAINELKDVLEDDLINLVNTKIRD